MAQKKECLECGETFLGRSDKKICSSQCRSQFNNKLNSNASNFVRNINNILRKNRRIMEELNPTGKIKIHRDELVERGFNFSYFTNIYQTKSGNIYYFCYEHGYLELDHNHFTLVIRQEYVV